MKFIFALIILVSLYSAIYCKNHGADSSDGGNGHGKGNFLKKFGGRGRGMHFLGCNFIEKPKDIEDKACCPDLPESFKHNYNDIENCKKECEMSAEKICCISKCVFPKNITGNDDVIDAEKYSNLILETTTKKHQWAKITKSIVANCIQFVKDTSKTVTCESTQNSAIDHCVKRSLFLQCVEPAKSPECASLFNYANACPFYPMPAFKHRHGHKGDNAEIADSGRTSDSKKEKEQEENDDEQN
jgi:hypothetical protein